MSQFDQLGDAEPIAGGMKKIGDTVRSRRDQLLPDEIRIDLFGTRFPAALQRSHTFQESFLECAADRHDLAHRLHLCAESWIGIGKFLKGPFRDLHDDIVQHRLERCRRLLCDVIGNFVEGIADGEFRRNLRNRKTGRFRS